MNLTGTSARFELVANADLTGENTTGSAQIGTPNTSLAYTTAPDIAYSLGMYITSGDTLTLDLASAAVTGGVTGTNQVETATVTAASGVTSNGTCNVVFAATSVTGSPITVPVALTTAQTTASLIAVEIRSALAATSAIAAQYTIGGSGANITATRIEKRDDETLNIAIPAGLGITAAMTSTGTTAGVGESKAYRINGMAWNQTDHEGKALETASKLHSVLIKSSESSAGNAVITGPDRTDLLAASAIHFGLDASGNLPWSASDVTFEASGGDAILTIDIHAGT